MKHEVSAFSHLIRMNLIRQIRQKMVMGQKLCSCHVVRKKENEPLENFMTAIRFTQSPSKFKTEKYFRQRHMDITIVIFNRKKSHFMMMSWHAKSFPHYWPFVRRMNGSPSQGDNDMELWCFFIVSLKKLFSKQSSYHKSNFCITPWGDYSGHLWIPITNRQCWVLMFSLLFVSTNYWTSSQASEIWNQSWQALAPFNGGFLSKKASNAEASLLFFLLAWISCWTNS